MGTLQLERYPLITEFPTACSWITFLSNLQRSPDTIDAYARDLQDYLSFCRQHQIDVEKVGKKHIALYIRDMAERPRQRKGNKLTLDFGLANSTIQRHLTAIRSFYDYLVEEGQCSRNPVQRGRYTPGNIFGGARERGLLRRYTKLPWIPDETEWRAILEAAAVEPLRNRVMFALAYDGALRREELCSLATTDIEPGKQLIHLRAETTKNHRDRTVFYSDLTAQLYAAYLAERRILSRERGLLFLSGSRRNHSQPISKWTWSKVVSQIADRADVSEFTTHTLRHLRLTDLARAGWELREIADFAGHRSVETTRLYIEISGREIAEKVAASMKSLALWRTGLLLEGTK